jgi:coenzyme F420-reducing hydrogenase delta subunit/Pyruvate/2-oxoacid:ferredoxin oxidoreductase delta subunit
MEPSAASPASPVGPRTGFAARLLAGLDAGANRLYGSRYNPLYRSGTVAVFLLVVLLVTGLYLLLFYRVGSPWASVERITGQAWLGRWIRGVHRYASDLAVLAVAVHAFRIFAQGRSWGRRTLPWVSGVALLGLVLVSGWTGFVMVWDEFGRLLAVEGARLLDLLPLFSEPLGRAFVGERQIPGAFFFLNLFLHIALPIGLGVGLLVHVARVARPVLFPSRPAMAWLVVLLVAAAIAFPVAIAPEADPLRLPGAVPIDLVYAFWLPLTRGAPASWVAAGSVALGVGLLLVPRATRPRPADLRPASSVDERICTGCEQCVQDCPWEAIAMTARSDGRETLVARVDPRRCVSCGICAGSCAPMGVGPPGRTGRDQLALAREFAAAQVLAGEIVVIACSRGAGGVTRGSRFDGAPVLAVDCAGSLHSSVVELLVRTGAGGVLVLGCPMDDCWNREGAKWLELRLLHGREAELQERVDRRRVALEFVSLAERGRTSEVLHAFRERIRALERVRGEEEVDLLRLCAEPVPSGEGS